MLGLPIPGLKYAVYTLPYFIPIMWLFQGNFRFHPSLNVLPFLLLIAMSLFSIPELDYNGIRRGGFILTYTLLFFLYDFQKITYSVRNVNLIFIAIFIFQMSIFLGSDLITKFYFSFLESRSTLESGYSFAFGVFALYYLLKQRYVWFMINLVLAALTLKRIVLIGLAVTILVWIIPKKVRRIFLNPYLITLCVGLFLYLAVGFADGDYDKLLIKLFDISPNHLLQGRQEIWRRMFDAIDFNFLDFSVYGIGLGKSVTVLMESFHQDTLIHSDFLGIMVEYGVVITIVFAFLLNFQKSDNERLMALYLTVVFISDNVLIYQFVMLPYLLLQIDLSKRETEQKQMMK